MEPSDDELMGRCRAGDGGTMDVLVSRYYTRLYNFAFRMMHQREAAEDVVQETFLRAYRNAGRYRAESRFSTWLFAIAANLCRTELRRRSRHAECEWNDLIELAAPDSVERTVMLQIEGAEVRKALERLSPEHRMALILFYFEGLSYLDVASICGCSLGTVKSRIHYAIARLRSLMPAAVGARRQEAVRARA